MKKYLALLTLAVLIPMGCAKATAPGQPAPPVATGYGNATDQKLGQDLALVRALAAQAKTDYATLAPALQAEEKIPLNSFILAVDAADQTYLAYHNGLTTLSAAQTALANAQAAQSSYTAIAKAGK